MFVRIWRTGLNAARVPEYDQFAATSSAEMFRRQDGCVAVLFTRAGHQGVVVSVWRDQDAIHALATSPTYQEVANRLLDSGLIQAPQTVEVMEMTGGWSLLSEDTLCLPPADDRHPST